MVSVLSKNLWIHTFHAILSLNKALIFWGSEISKLCHQLRLMAYDGMAIVAGVQEWIWDRGMIHENGSPMCFQTRQDYGSRL